jgi:hypothetical protein
MLREVVPVLRAAGRSVFLLSPTSESEKNLKEDFPDAMTFQQFQSDIERGILDLQPGSVICLDEVSMISMPQGHWIVSLAKDKQCRLVTLGDVDQYKSVERGDFIRVLQDSGSVRSEELTTTYRAQVGYLRDTYYDLKSGNAERRQTAFNRQDEHGDMRELEDWDAGREDALETYLGAIKEGQTAIMASPIHVEARSAAAVAREMLKSDCLIGEEDHMLMRLERLDADGPELRDTRHYQPDRVVKFHTKVRGGFNPGDKWRVVEQLDNGQCLLERGQVEKTFDPKTKGEWSIYDVHEMAASIGERVRIPEGFEEGGVVFKNGDLPKITAIDSKRVTFEDGRSVANDFLHVDQAHCVTGYSTECRTVDQYIGLAPMTALGAVTATDVYVGTTRARQKAIWYTDNKEEFREAALRDEERKSPFDFEQVVTQAPAMTKDVEKIKAVDLQQDNQVSEKEKVRIEPQNNVGNVTNISPDLADRELEEWQKQLDAAQFLQAAQQNQEKQWEMDR